MTKKEVDRKKLFKKLRIGLCISCLTVIGIALSSCYAQTALATTASDGDVISLSSDVVRLISALPVQGLLALIALGSMTYNYRLTVKHDKILEEHFKIMGGIAQKMADSPCVMTYEEIQAKYCKR